MGIFDKFLKKNDETPQLPVASPLLPTKKKVLVCVSDDTLKITFIQAFEGENFEVNSVGNGADGLNMLLTFEPNLVLIDLELPVLNGITMLHSLRALPAYKFTPVIVISEKGDAETIRQTKTYGSADVFILKSEISMPNVVELTKGLI